MSRKQSFNFTFRFLRAGEEPTVIGGEEPTVIGGEEPTVIGGEEPTVIGGEEPTVIGGEEPTVIGDQGTALAGEEPTVIGGQGMGEINCVEEETDPLCKTILGVAVLALVLGVVVEITSANVLGMSSTALLLISVNLMLLYIIRCSACRC